MKTCKFYYFRTFRIWELSNEIETTHNVDCENSYDEWRFSTDIIKSWKEINDDRFYFQTLHGNIYCCDKYSVIPTTNLVVEYCMTNKFTSREILSPAEFNRMFTNDLFTKNNPA